MWGSRVERKLGRVGIKPVIDGRLNEVTEIGLVCSMNTALLNPSLGGATSR